MVESLQIKEFTEIISIEEIESRVEL